jgi:hypothetical protein
LKTGITNQRAPLPWVGEGKKIKIKQFKIYYLKKKKRKTMKK